MEPKISIPLDAIHHFGETIIHGFSGNHSAATTAVFHAIMTDKPLIALQHAQEAAMQALPSAAAALLDLGR